MVRWRLVSLATDGMYLGDHDSGRGWGLLAFWVDLSIASLCLESEVVKEDMFGELRCRMTALRLG